MKRRDFLVIAGLSTVPEWPAFLRFDGWLDEASLHRISKEMLPPKNRLESQEQEYASQVLNDLAKADIRTQSQFRTYLLETRQDSIEEDRRYVEWHRKNPAYYCRDMSEEDALFQRELREHEKSRIQQGVFFTHTGLIRIGMSPYRRTQN